MTDGIILRNKVLKGQMYTLEQMGDNYLIANKSQRKTLKITPVLATAELIFKQVGKSIDETELKGGDNMSGYDKAKETADKLKEEKAEQEEKAVAQKEEALNQLQMVRQNSSLSKMFEEEAKKEMSDSLGAQPLLKLHVVGRSNNVLLDGSQPEDGSFFYVPSQEAFVDPEIHVLVMSEGFYAEGLPDDNGKTKIGYNILLGGTIIADGDRTMRPFLMYITSQSIRQSFWDFRNEFNKYARLMRVPKTSLVVKMTREKVANPNPKWVKINPTVNNIKFSVQKLEDNSPALVTDEEEFTALIDIQAMLKEMTESIILAKRVEKPLADGEVQGKASVNTTRDVVEGEITDADAPVEALF